MDKKQNYERYVRILKHVAENFNTRDKITSIQPHGNGLMNKTFLITTQSNQKYIIQQISKNLGDIDKLMRNVSNITEFILCQNKKTLKLVKTKNGKNYIKLNNSCFRMFEYIDGKVYDTINDVTSFEKAGIAFAEFAKALENFDVNKIHVTMPDFHNTLKRYENFLHAIKNGNKQRIIKAKPQIDFLIANNIYIEKIEQLISTGLKERIIHGDTKINNVIFNNDEVYVIDFDTIMKSYLCYDFGDAIRSGCNTAKEDAPEKSVSFNLNNYSAFAKGYLSVWKNLSKIELDSLVIAPQLVTYELALRFLTDYLQNDIYFNIKTPEDNLIRTKNQIALLNQMEKNKVFMKDLLYKYNNITLKKNNDFDMQL